MKVNGWTVCGANVEYIVIPRASAPNGRLVFRAEAVLDMKLFHKLVPTPKPKLRILAGGKKELDPDDKFFQSATKDYADKRWNYIIITSLKNTDGLEWDTVKYTDPNTWGFYEKELQDAGLNNPEIQMIVNGVMIANSLNESKIEEARADFLASLVAGAGLSSQKDVQLNTQSGEHASA